MNVYAIPMVLKEEVVERCKKGDASAFTTIYNSCCKDVYNTIYRIVNHSAEAEDILQECFITVYHRLHTFENRSSLKTWIKRIAINQSIDALRKRKITFSEINETYNSIEQKESDEELEFTDLKVDAVKNAISNLAPGYRAVASMYLFDEMPQEEIAQILGISHSTVRTQYKKAKEKIWEYLEYQK